MEEHLHLKHLTGFDLTKYGTPACNSLNPLIASVLPILTKLQSLQATTAPGDASKLLNDLLSELEPLAEQLVEEGYTAETILTTKQIITIVIDHYSHRYNWAKIIPNYHLQIKSYKQALRLAPHTNLYTLADRIDLQTNVSKQCLILIYWCIKHQLNQKSPHPRKAQQSKEQVLNTKIFNLLWVGHTNFKKNLFLSSLPDSAKRQAKIPAWKIHCTSLMIFLSCLMGGALLINTGLSFLNPSHVSLNHID